MEFTPTMFAELLRGIITLDNSYRSAINADWKVKNKRQTAEKKENKQLSNGNKQSFSSCGSDMVKALNDTAELSRFATNQYLNEKDGVLSELAVTNEKISLLEHMLSQLRTSQADAEETDSPYRHLESIEDLMTQSYYITPLTASASDEECRKFGQQCRAELSRLRRSAQRLRWELLDTKKLQGSYSRNIEKLDQQLKDCCKRQMDRLDVCTYSYARGLRELRQKNAQECSSSNTIRKNHMDQASDTFLKQYPPQDMMKELSRIYSREPVYPQYRCCREMPEDFFICTMDYPLSKLGLCDETLSFLNLHYPYLIQNDRVCLPHTVPFNKKFNHMFCFEEKSRTNVVKDACALGMHLFAVIPPGKLNVTLVDPVSNGDSFAMFNQLVNLDDRTSEVINGKVWSNSRDIENKLRVMTDHISNITQRCLQGKYENIFEYNCVAEQNAEAYQVLMLMDFPAGMTDESLRILEQIVISGPKCGVFVQIFRNENQYVKISERARPLVSNIETHLKCMSYSEDGHHIQITDKTVKGSPVHWCSIPLPNPASFETMVGALKHGIRNADRIEIGIDKLKSAEQSGSSRFGIRVPIGVYGANEIQYLTLGVGGSHHALIAGIAGSGKSSLIHTILIQALKQYGPEELVIYLVDFKRGVEFKVYADFQLPSFKVIAIESEREFGYNILLALEEEQQIRANISKRNHVETIEDYRQGNRKMPRVLVIMDEFQELFVNMQDEVGRKSAEMMERVVRQGRAFGIHMILATQSYSNVSGLSPSVYKQMAVRIALKCSNEDANMMLENGSAEVEQISINDPGRAVYNSEAGSKEFNNHFRVAYIKPSTHRQRLQEISEKYSRYIHPGEPTRILLSNIEDNHYSIYNQFQTYRPSDCSEPGQLYVGEPLSVENDMPLSFSRNAGSNLLLVGNDSEKARNLFTFSLLSLCINYHIRHGKAPEKPFIYLLNCKPLSHRYFKDMPNLLASKLLPQYIRNVSFWDEEEVGAVLTDLHRNAVSAQGCTVDTDQYLFVFGYQRAELLKNDQQQKLDDVFAIFDISNTQNTTQRLTNKTMFEGILGGGAPKGVHTVLWQDSYEAMIKEDSKLPTYFAMRLAFDMLEEEYSRFIGENNTASMSKNNAYYYNRARDNQKFRPYQTPDEDWLRGICSKLV